LSNILSITGKVARSFKVKIDPIFCFAATEQNVRLLYAHSGSNEN
jgi:hypothetical protein